MNKSIQKGLRFFLFLSIGIVILWWLYKDMNANELLKIMKNDVGYGWIVLSLMMGLLSHVSRTIRWQMLIEPVDKRPGIVNTFLAVMIGYLANLAIPRMGEISRCGVLSKYEKLSFSRLVGTVVTERILDLIMLLLALGLMISLQYNFFADFVHNKMDLSELTGFFSSWWFGLIILFAAGAIIVFRQNILNSQMYFKLKGLWLKFKEGLFSYRNVKNKPLFFTPAKYISINFSISRGSNVPSRSKKNVSLTALSFFLPSPLCFFACFWQSPVHLLAHRLLL